MPVFCVRHNQRRRDNGDQRSDRFRPRYDVSGERAAGRAFPRHDDEVSRDHFIFNNNVANLHSHIISYNQYQRNLLNYTLK